MVPRTIIFLVLGAVSIAFHLGLIFSGLVSNLVARPIHMAFALPWIFLFATAGRSLWSGALFAGAGILGCIYIVLSEAALSDQYGSFEGGGQVALAYGLFGDLLPGEFGHPGLPVESFLGTLTIAEGGLWGSLTGVSVNIVAVSVIMGAALNAGEAAQGFMNLASAAAGRLKDGAAKVSVLSSAFFGSISGSASANVASTGAITLPAMRKLGYPKPFAAAVEAVASSGGQIMPPLMGAGAFVMVELTGIPYTGIISAAVLPALLYFAAVWIGINAFAERHDRKGLAPEDQPALRSVVNTTLFFAVPFTVLLERMFIGGYTPQYAACVAILVAVLMLFVDAQLTFSWSQTWDRLQAVFLTARQQIAMTASIILCASIVIGVLGQIGLGVKITSLILSSSASAVWLALLLTALACLIFGMEVPTTAAYVICVSVAGPALQSLGLPPLQAMMLGIGLYLIPLAMIANPDLIVLASVPGAAVASALKVGIGLAAISYGIIALKVMTLRVVPVAVGLAVLFVPLDILGA
jgi:TRAP transporter 4TM/12TM fusion protein